MPVALATTYCTADDVRGLLSAEGVDLRLDHNGDGEISDTELDLLGVRAIQYATSRVNLYCQPAYAASELVKSYLVNEWATILAAHWLCSVRCNPVPRSVANMAFGSGARGDPGAVGEMQAVQLGRLQIPSIVRRNVDWPAWSAGRVDPRYRLRKHRVERGLSEQTPTQYPQNVDRPADLIYEI